MGSQLNNDESCGIACLKILERNLTTLKTEANCGLQIHCELESKCERFNELSNNLTDKLRSLWSLANTHQPSNNEIKVFTDNIFTSWTIINQQVCKECSKIRVASRTFPGIPLSLLLSKIKKESIAIKMKLQTEEVTHANEDVLKGYAYFNEIMELLHNLENCDEKVQKYLIVTKMLPHLLKLEYTVNKFVLNTRLLSVKKSSFSDMSVFLLVSKLLTGELFGNESVNLNSVLADNAPKRPVFIIKNNKRKMDITLL